MNQQKRLFILVFFLITASVNSFAQNEIVAKLVKEGMALHDKGDYEGAIAKYDRALILDPNDFEANYEKSSSCLYAGKFDESIALSKFLLEHYSNYPPVKGVYVNLGSAYDDKGNADSAILIYSEGIQKFPGFYLLYFNKGLTLARQKEWDNADVNFQKALEIKPDHPGSLFYTALLQEQTNKVAALMSGLVFLAVEPEGKRAKNMYEYVWNQFASFAQQDGKKPNTINITVDDLGRKDKENNFSTVKMMLGLTVASALTDTVKAKTNVDKLSLYVQMMTSALSTGQKDGKGMFWQTYAPFFIAMKEKNLVNVFAHIASITSGDEANIKWISENQEAFRDFFEWVDKYEWKK